MIDVDVPAEASAPSAPAATPKPAPRKSMATRWWAAFTVLAVVGLSALGYLGYEASKDLKGGASTELVTDPAAPGYMAAVPPSSVNLIALTDASNRLDSFIVVLPVTGAPGGTVLWTLGELEIESGDSTRDLTTIFAEDGFDAARQEVERLLGFGATDAAVVGPTELASLAQAAGPIEISNPDRVSVDVDGVRTEKYAPGPLTLGPTDLSEFLTVVSVGEAPENRSTRVGLVVEALLAALAKGDVQPSDEATTSEGASLAEMLAGVGEGDVEFVVLATKQTEVDGEDRYQPDPDQISAQLAGLVQFPVSGFAGQRPRVRVRNGTADTSLAKAVAPQLAAAGGEVILVGNADSLDAATTSVVYSSPSFEAAAQRMAELFSVTAVRSENLSDVTDIDVVLGADYTG